MKKINLVGEIYGDLQVISFSHRTENNGMSHYFCQCLCGKQKIVSHGNLRTGHTTSCGCKRERSGAESANFVHGMAHKNRAYKSWNKIKERCYNPNDISYPNYGGKGVVMSEVFREDFTAFYAEIGEPPNSIERWSVDRIDNNLGYVSGNLRWATSKQQARNKTMNSNNSSGETGVQFYHSGKPTHTTYAVATWYNVEGTPENKKFSVRKLGLMPAFKAAVEHRRKMIEELNAKGAGYTENHGK